MESSGDSIRNKSKLDVGSSSVQKSKSKSRISEIVRVVRGKLNTLTSEPDSLNNKRLVTILYPDSGKQLDFVCKLKSEPEQELEIVDYVSKLVQEGIIDGPVKITVMLSQDQQHQLWHPFKRTWISRCTLRLTNFFHRK